MTDKQESKGIGLGEVAVAGVTATGVAAGVGYAVRPAQKRFLDTVAHAIETGELLKTDTAAGNALHEVVKKNLEILNRPYAAGKVLNDAEKLEGISLVKKDLSHNIKGPMVAFKAMSGLGKGAVVLGALTAGAGAAYIVNSWRNSGDKVEAEKSQSSTDAQRANFRELQRDLNQQQAKSVSR